MKEFQLTELMKILDNFYFLIHENYGIKETTIGLRAYPSVVFKNYQTGIEVHIIRADLGCECDDYNVYIMKSKWFSTKFIGINEQMGYSHSICGDKLFLCLCSEYIQQHLMPVIRGEQWPKK